MTDILDLPDWTLLAKRSDGDEYELEAEYRLLPGACTKCGSVGRLYKHGTKDTTYRDSPIRGHPVRLLARVQRFRCRDCGETFLQPLGSIQEAMRMTERCAEYVKDQCLRDTFTRIAEHVGCDEKTIRTLASAHKRLGRPLKGRSPLGSPLMIRLSAEQRAKLDALGGADWLRERIDRARAPTARATPADVG